MFVMSADAAEIAAGGQIAGMAASEIKSSASHEGAETLQGALSFACITARLLLPYQPPFAYVLNAAERCQPRLPVQPSASMP